MPQKVTVLGIYGSPRKHGNTDRLLDRALEGARSAGAEIRSIFVRDLTMSGCIACGGCDKTGQCVVDDSMQAVYPLLERADAVILASPIYFYGFTAQAKALIDRSQAMWSRRLLEGTSGKRKPHRKGNGYVIAAGATRGKQLFDGIQLVARYFFDALDMDYKGGLFFRDLEKRNDVARRTELLQESFELGERAVHEAQG